MKILYSAGNRIGANSQLCRVLTSLSKKHTIRIAAYIKSSHSLAHIDWTLDALYHNKIAKRNSCQLRSLFGHSNIPVVNIENAKKFLSEAIKFEPDLIISDGEHVSAHIAKTLGVELWYCSALHLLDGIDWSRGQLRYTSLLENTRKSISKMPEPDKIFVYSPFGDVAFRPILRTGYEWMQPYHITGIDGHKQYNNICVINEYERFSSIVKILNSLTEKVALVSPHSGSFNNIDLFLSNDEESYKKLLGGCEKVFTTGETSYVADALYNNKNICISPSLNDPETLLNAILVREYSVGSDVAQIELMDFFALDELEKAFSKENKTDFLSKQEHPKLHERIV